MPALFKKIAAPSRQQLPGKPIPWYTWSDDFLEFVPAIKKAHKKAGDPLFLHLKHFKMYNYTFSSPLDKLDEGFINDFIPFCRAIRQQRLGNRILFFDNLINQKINGGLFHYIIGLFRSTLSRINKDEMSALYAPLTVTTHEDDFPLHCDLYIPRVLWNVFEEVAPGDDGASTFLTTKDFFEKVAPHSGMPAGVVKKLRKLIYIENNKDRYEDFFSLLYDNSNSWTNDLKEQINLHVQRLKFRKGQGYMIHDRLWMHGRDRCYGQVTGKRLHRLIFNTTDCMASQPVID
jgi:hypothetical protein